LIEDFGFAGFTNPYRYLEYCFRVLSEVLTDIGVAGGNDMTKKVECSRYPNPIWVNFKG